jgi:hypothetical protein
MMVLLPLCDARNPFAMFLLLQGLETLSLRAQRHSDNVLAEELFAATTASSAPDSETLSTCFVCGGSSMMGKMLRTFNSTLPDFVPVAMMVCLGVVADTMTGVLSEF